MIRVLELIWTLENIEKNQRNGILWDFFPPLPALTSSNCIRKYSSILVIFWKSYGKYCININFTNQICFLSNKGCFTLSDLWFTVWWILSLTWKNPTALVHPRSQAWRCSCLPSSMNRFCRIDHWVTLLPSLNSNILVKVFIAAFHIFSLKLLWVINNPSSWFCCGMFPKTALFNASYFP